MSPRYIEDKSKGEIDMEVDIIDTDRIEALRQYLSSGSYDLLMKPHFETYEGLLTEVERLSEIEQEWLVMWATLEELNLVADVRKDMTLHGIVFPTDEDMEGDEE